MADNGRPRRGVDESLALYLASGRTIRAAAAKLGIGERTAYRRWASPEFRSRVTLLRSEMYARASACMTSRMNRAVVTLGRLLKAKGENIRLGAARALLELGSKMRENVELEQRLVALEQGQAAAGNSTHNLNGFSCNGDHRP